MLGVLLALGLSACSNTEKPTTNSDSSTSETELFGNVDDKPLHPDGMAYDSRISLDENIEHLNTVLEAKTGERFSLASIDDYESGEARNWTLVIDGERAGIDLATWKIDAASDPSEKSYMDGILFAFTFFYGQEMGDSLWRLTGDLVDNGADETQYGFHHVGGEAVYKNGASATYGSSESSATHTTMYVWITPEKSLG